MDCGLHKHGRIGTHEMAGKNTMEFTSVDKLDDNLSEPGPDTVETLRDVPGDIVLLGAGGKMGPSLARMARRASDMAGIRRRIVAVSRFSDASLRKKFEEADIETIAGDLLDGDFLATLPNFENVIYMVGQKFGTSTAAASTWATNAYLPGIVCEQFSRSRMVAFSTGNVYPLVPIASGGCRETDPLDPKGEYGMSALARERIFEYFSQKYQIPTVILRLNYATEMRYGVLVDLARKIQQEEPVSLAMGYFNCIWQGDANNMTLRSLAHTESPPQVFNMTGDTTIRCRDVCDRLGQMMNKTVHYQDDEGPTALLSDATRAYRVLGRPTVCWQEMVDWTAQWVMAGGETLDKPTHFEVRDGKF